jgi:hypothetical protein
MVAAWWPLDQWRPARRLRPVLAGKPAPRTTHRRQPRTIALCMVCDRPPAWVVVVAGQPRQGELRRCWTSMNPYEAELVHCTGGGTVEVVCRVDPADHAVADCGQFVRTQAHVRDIGVVRGDHLGIDGRQRQLAVGDATREVEGRHPGATRVHRELDPVLLDEPARFADDVACRGCHSGRRGSTTGDRGLNDGRRQHHDQGNRQSRGWSLGRAAPRPEGFAHLRSSASARRSALLKSPTVWFAYVRWIIASDVWPRIRLRVIASMPRLSISVANECRRRCG